MAALRAGDSVLVDVASAGPRSYVNTASAGIYVDLVRARQQLEERLGKWPAVLVALVRVLRTSQPLDLIVEGRRRRIWLLFAGNCGYEPEGAASARRDAGRNSPGSVAPPEVGSVQIAPLPAAG